MNFQVDYYVLYGHQTQIQQFSATGSWNTSNEQLCGLLLLFPVLFKHCCPIQQLEKWI